jgi:biopolymer transport protein ExbB
MRFLSIFLFLISSVAAFGADYRQAAGSAQSDLDGALERLEKARNKIAVERIPVSKKLSALRSEVLVLRREMEQSRAVRDNKIVDLAGIERELKQRKDEVSYLATLMSDYIQRFETQIHISEVQVYEAKLKDAKLVGDDASLSDADRLVKQVSVVNQALDRIKDLAGGHIFEGKALSPEKVLEDGTFALVGPVALFASKASNAAGIVVVEHGSYQPTVVTIDEVTTGVVQNLMANRGGEIPVDPTQGDALKIIATKETIVEHIQKGGVVIYFILGLAALALVIAIFKWFEISGVKRARPEDLHAILDLIRDGKSDEALEKARSIKGPVGLLLVDAVEHADESKDLLNEVLYERLLQTQPKLERMIPFIAVVAATSPLLGLLGTVTGMIKTFKLITVFGTGDARSLSSGISEALITTEFGLLVAIPSLIVHALLLRKTKGVLASMEQSAVAFTNGLETKVQG